MLYHSIELTYESIREGCRKFGQQYANQVQRKRSSRTDKWHLDEVVVTIQGKQYYLWRAVDSEGNVLNILMQHQLTAHRYREQMRQRLEDWQENVGLKPAA